MDSANSTQPLIGIVMGSASDREKMAAAAQIGSTAAVIAGDVLEAVSQVMGRLGK